MGLDAALDSVMMIYSHFTPVDVTEVTSVVPKYPLKAEQSRFFRVNLKEKFQTYLERGVFPAVHEKTRNS